MWLFGDTTSRTKLVFQGVHGALGASAFRMAAATFLDATSWPPGMTREVNDAVSASTQVRMTEAPTLLELPVTECPQVWIRLPRTRRPESWHTIQDPVVPLEANLRGHPFAGLLLGPEVGTDAAAERLGENGRMGKFVRPSEIPTVPFDTCRRLLNGWKENLGMQFEEHTGASTGETCRVWEQEPCASRRVIKTYQEKGIPRTRGCNHSLRSRCWNPLAVYTDAIRSRVSPWTEVQQWVCGSRALQCHLPF